MPPAFQLLEDNDNNIRASLLLNKNGSGSIPSSSSSFSFGTFQMIDNESDAVAMANGGASEHYQQTPGNAQQMSQLAAIRLAEELDTPNCTYRYDLNDDLIRLISLWLDGPITIIAALLAFVGCHFAVRFLARAGLNKDLTAALYTLCVCDSFLISMVVIYHSLEACSILLFGTNFMWDEQSSVLITHGIVSAATTASTLLVVFITFQRFLVVWFPLRYARIREPKRTENMRKSSSSLDETQTEFSGIFRSGGGLVRTLSKRLLSSHKQPNLRKLFRPFLFPMCVIVFAFMLNFSVFFEFELVPCFAFANNAFSMQLYPTQLRQSQSYNLIRTTIAMSSQTIGPILCITLLTIVTEYKVHSALKARRILFEAQNRRRSLVALEELKEKVSRTVSIFIAIKFLILRSLPIFFDIYETFYGIESFGIVLSILVRLSDFGVVLNSATNSLAYFGKTEFFANRLKSKLLKEKQHIMVAKILPSRFRTIQLAASACLVTGISPKCLPKPLIKYSQSSRSMPFSDLARRREQRKTVTYGVMISSQPNSAKCSPAETPLLRSSHFLSLRNGSVPIARRMNSSPLAKEMASTKAASKNGKMEEGENQQQKRMEMQTSAGDLLGGAPMEFNSETASEPLSETFNNTQMPNGGGGEGGGMPSNHHHQMNGTKPNGRLVEM